MKLKTLFFILFLFVLVITPFEAIFFNQKLTWMYILNLTECLMFGVGLFVGKCASHL